MTTPNDIARSVARETKWSLNAQQETEREILTLHRVDVFFALLFGAILGFWFGRGGF